MKIKRKRFRLDISLDKVLSFFRVSKYKKLNLEIFLENNFNFNIAFICFIRKRPSDDFKFVFNFVTSWLWFFIGLIDYRLWDYYTDKPIYVSYDEYNEICKSRTSKPKYKYRKEKTKWFMNSKYLKIYNHNFLNDVFGRTLDVAFYKIPIYFKFQYGFDPFSSFCLGFDINPNENYKGYPWYNFQITLFSIMFKIEFGKNTIMREENLFDIKDFIALVNAKADLYMESNNQNVIEYLVNSNRYNYLKEAIKLIDINKFDKVELLTDILLNSYSSKKCFDLVLNSIDEIDIKELSEIIKDYGKEHYNQVWLNDVIQKFNLEI